MKKKALLVGAAIVVVAGLVGVGVVRSRSAKPLAVQTAKASRQRIVQKVSGTGKIRPKIQVEISADVSAKIIQLPVVEGQRVEKGALLVGLDRERYVASVESAEATVRSAEANATLVRQNMNRAKSEYGRSKELLAKGLEAQSAFEAKQAEYEVEAARYASTMDQVEQAVSAVPGVEQFTSASTEGRSQVRVEFSWATDLDAAAREGCHLAVLQDEDVAGEVEEGGVLLPFEGDRTLSVILSKAFLLAEDISIKDETIIRQIRSR